MYILLGKTLYQHFTFRLLIYPSVNVFGYRVEKLKGRWIHVNNDCSICAV